MEKIKGRLLIIDDEIELSESMKELFEETASEIFIACNGQEALHLLANTKIDCIVSDIKMPVMDGFKFLKTARQQGFIQPVIFFTGHGTEQLKREVWDSGVAELFMKPNFLMLEAAIRKYMTASRENY